MINVSYYICYRNVFIFNSKKCTAGKKVLHDSTFYDQNSNENIRAALIPDNMSSDESAVESDDNENDVSNKKVFRKHVLQWRSPEFSNYIESLDRKIACKRTSRGKQMVVPVKEGGQSEWPLPEDFLEWAYVADWTLK